MTPDRKSLVWSFHRILLMSHHNLLIHLKVIRLFLVSIFAPPFPGTFHTEPQPFGSPPPGMASRECFVLQAVKLGSHQSCLLRLCLGCLKEGVTCKTRGVNTDKLSPTQAATLILSELSLGLEPGLLHTPSGPVLGHLSQDCNPGLYCVCIHWGVSRGRCGPARG